VLEALPVVSIEGGAQAIATTNTESVAPIVSNEGGAHAIPVTANLSNEGGAHAIPVTSFVSNEGTPAAIDYNVAPGDGSYLFDPANWADFDATEREEIPGWLGHALGNGQPHVMPGHRLSLLIQAMAAMPTASAEIGGVVAVEPPPPGVLVASII
jgi:hypothetical protein